MSEPRDRVLEAAYECIGRFGMGKTTIDDVAKVSGISRATIYRLFPGGKDQLLRETVGWEMTRFFVSLAEAVVSAPDFPSLVEEALVFAHRRVREHEVLQKVLVTEPDRLLPLMTVESERVVAAITNFVRPYLEAEDAAGRLRAGVDVDQSADWVARTTLSLIGSPGSNDLDDPAAVRHLVRTHLLGPVLVQDEPV